LANSNFRTPDEIEFGTGVLIHEISHLLNTADDVHEPIDCAVYGPDWPMFYSEQLDQARHGMLPTSNAPSTILATCLLKTSRVSSADGERSDHLRV
jgi:hypothetical protein